MTKRIKIAETDEEIKSCFPVMAELRPHITEAGELLVRVKRQQSINGYQLAFLAESTEVKAVAGFTIWECLAWGKVICVEELVTTSSERSKGYGQSLFDWIVEYARGQGCAELHLDSRVHRFDAHRFYLRNRMEIRCHHFGLTLSQGAS